MTIFINISRLIAFSENVDTRRALVITSCALPPCVPGAYGYTRLTAPGVSIVIGIAMIVVVVSRHTMRRLGMSLSMPGIAAAGAGYGLIVGGTSGTGVILVSILLAAGLQGQAVIATNAGISLGLGLVKASVFQATGALPLSAWILALLIGVAATPGAFLAKEMT